MTNGAAMIPAPLVVNRRCSLVRVTLVPQVHGLLQRAADNLFFFAHVNHVLCPEGLSHRGIGMARLQLVHAGMPVSRGAGSPRRSADSEDIATAGNGDQPLLHGSEITSTSNLLGRSSHNLRRTTQ